MFQQSHRDTTAVAVAVDECDDEDNEFEIIRQIERNIERRDMIIVDAHKDRYIRIFGDSSICMYYVPTDKEICGGDSQRDR